MAITQTQDEFVEIARTVGIPTERAEVMWMQMAPISDLAVFQRMVNRMGYYSEKADHLMDAGILFVG